MDWYVEFIEMCAQKMLPFVDKMGIDSTIVALATNNVDQLYDVQVMIGLAWLLIILIVVHSFVKFAQLWDLFVHMISLLQFPFIRKICLDVL
jgi:hypothetical protein